MAIPRLKLMVSTSLSIVPVILVSWMACCQSAHSQNASLPKFYPIAEHTYTLTDGLLRNCINEVIFDDRTGRMYLSNCGTDSEDLSMAFYGYDGKRIYPSAFKVGHQLDHLVSKKSLVANCFFGYFNYQQENNESSAALFYFDPITNEQQIIDLSEHAPFNINNILEQGSIVYILGEESNTDDLKILAVNNGNIETLHQFHIELPSGNTSRKTLAVTDKDFWISIANYDLFRINRNTLRMTRYPIPAPPQELPHDNRTITVAGDGHLYFNANQFSIYRWNDRKQQLDSYPYIPAHWPSEEIFRTSLSKDDVGNVLLVYEKYSGETSATLIDQGGQSFDYSLIANKALRAVGNDFKKNVIFPVSGLRFVEVSPNKAVQKTETITDNRAMVQLDDSTLYLNRFFGKVTFRNNNWYALNESISCLDASGYAGGWVVDTDGRIWLSTVDKPGRQNHISRYDPQDGTCEVFDPGFIFNQFCLLSNQQAALLANGYVYKWNVQSGKPELFGQQKIKGRINQIMAGRDGNIWVATSTGLVKVNGQTGELKAIVLKEDFIVGILKIHEDPAGRLWLGSIYHGLFIYDPVTEEMKIIDQSKGLSNDIVPGILQDEEGDIWAGTFHGITVISPEGVVKGKIYEEDGLASNECNRWSMLKMWDGRLVFGTPIGLNIIDPKLWKSQIDQRPAPKIYHTSLTSDIPGEADQQNNLTVVFQKENHITLPANNRNLTITYALSNYTSPNNSTFAYRFDRPGEDWHYIGPQRELTFNALPAGSYNILIKGNDGGKWSDPPLIVPITVEEFFYKKWWFYALLSMPFLAGLLLWQYRQREERKFLEAEVQRRTATIREQSEKLQELDQVKTRLYTNITHEFRTPLTVIMGVAEQMKEEIGKLGNSDINNSKTSSELLIPQYPNTSISQFLNTPISLIERNSANLLNLVNQMLDLQKLESGALPVHYQQDDLVRFLRYIAESFRSLAKVKKIHFRFLTDEQSLLMDFDAEKLRQVVANLLSNAIKFTQEGGEVYLHLDKIEGPLAHIRVRDTGIGIPAEKQPHIFDRFYQVDDSSTRRGEGTGIGLTLAAEMVKLMSGELAVTSQPGKGSTFSVKLPIKNTAPIAQNTTYNVPKAMLLSMENENVGSPKHPISPESSNGEKPLLLIVEDNADVVHYLVLCLKDNYELQIAMNGQEGIDTALDSVPDIIVTDVMMPIKDGFQLCDTLKNDERTSHIPIVMLTAKADVESRLSGLRRGADAYLAKPFHKQELLVILEQLVTLRKKLHARYATLTPPESAADEITQFEDAFVQKFHDLVHSRLDDEELDSTQLCHALGLSRSQLHRKLKALTGQSPIELLRQIRLEKAKELLQDESLTISEVAYSVGFKYPENFSRTFQEAFGQSPTEWREAHS